MDARNAEDAHPESMSGLWEVGDMDKEGEAMQESLTSAELAEINRFLTGGDWPIEGIGIIRQMYAHIQTCHELLEESMDWTHWDGCPGGYTHVDGSWAYACKCGFREWLPKVKEILGKEIGK